VNGRGGEGEIKAQWHNGATAQRRNGITDTKGDFGPSCENINWILLPLPQFTLAEHLFIKSLINYATSLNRVRFRVKRSD